MSNKVLYRSRKNRFIAGVCGGIGEYFDFDDNKITLLRIVWAISLFWGGLGFFAYLVAWVFIPDAQTKTSLAEEWVKDEKPKSKAKKKMSLNDSPIIILAFFLIFIGVMFLLNNLGWFVWSWNYTWPVLIIVIGLIIIFSRRGRK